jgi:hypothetical protein
MEQPTRLLLYLLMPRSRTRRAVEISHDDDNGKLPLTHPPILRLVNHSNRKRCMAGKYYNLVRAPKKKFSAPLQMPKYD